MSGLYLEHVDNLIVDCSTESLFQLIHQTNCESTKKELREKIMLSNFALVRHVIKRKITNMQQSLQELKMTYDDFFSIGCFGLWQAILKFKVESNYKFITFASILIQNEIGLFLRKNLKYNQDYSLQFKLENNDDGSSAEFIDTIMTETDFISKLVNNYLYTNLLTDFLNNLSPREKTIFLLNFIHEKNQVEISDEIGISQSYVSRILKDLKKKAYNKYKHYLVS